MNILMVNRALGTLFGGGSPLISIRLASLRPGAIK